MKVNLQYSTYIIGLNIKMLMLDKDHVLVLSHKWGLNIAIIQLQLLDQLAQKGNLLLGCL